jgi:squalene cyclase
MRTLTRRNGLASGLTLVLLLGTPPARGEEIPPEYRETVKKGLEWLARNQSKDGHWEGVNGQYAVSMTALGGMALLCEGSTLREGKYRENIRKAADWLMERIQPNGLIGNPSRESEGGRYMYGHGFGLLFLSCVVGDEGNSARRAKLMGLLEKAAKYTRDAQTSKGGWGYTSSKDGGNFDEGSVTITQVQALRAARNAGVAVPSEAIKDARKYLKESTNDDGGVRDSLTVGGSQGRPALTAAAVACGFGFGEYQGELVKKWIRFCQLHLGTPGDGRRMGHDEYTHYYWAQVVYVLGEDRYKKLFPEAKADEVISWKKYRKQVFDELKRSQSEDGSWSAESWTARTVGPIYVTACYLTMLQLDKAALPIYQH